MGDYCPSLPAATHAVAWASLLLLDLPAGHHAGYRAPPAQGQGRALQPQPYLDTRLLWRKLPHRPALGQHPHPQPP